MTATLPAGYRRIAFERVASTNDEARRLAHASAAEGLVVTSLIQEAGRGRQGRSWTSPAGNLYSSLLVRPAVPISRASEMVFTAGVAVCDALAHSLPGDAARCKWPNDILVRGRKIAGILAEAAAEPSGQCAYVVIGIGINIGSYPPDSQWPATSVGACGGKADVETALAALIASWDAWYRRWRADGFVPIRAAWLERAYGLGQTIEVKQDRGARRGRFLGLDASGALVLETVSGKRETHHFGDVTELPV